MKNLVLLLAYTLALGVSACAQQVYKPTGSTVIESAEGRFKAVFPSSPVETTSRKEGPKGEYLVVEFFSVVDPYAAFMITYTDFPKPARANQDELRAYYDRYCATIIEKAGARLITERDVVLSQKLGREMELVVGDQTVNYRVYNVGPRLYQTMSSFSSATPVEFGIKKIAITFLDSFQLIEKE